MYRITSLIFFTNYDNLTYTS